MKQYKKFIFFCIILVLCSGCQRERTAISLEEVEASVEKGVGYLAAMQNQTGSFDGYDFSVANPNIRFKDDPIGYTIYIANNLKNVAQDDAILQGIVKRAVQYIYSRSQLDRGNTLWAWRETLPYDADDTVLAGQILSEYHYPVNVDITRFQNADGTFRTWLDEDTEQSDLIVQVNVAGYMRKHAPDGANDMDKLIRLFRYKQMDSFYYTHYEAAFLYQLAIWVDHLDKLTERDFLMERAKGLAGEGWKRNSVIFRSYVGYFLAKYGLYSELQEQLAGDIVRKQLSDGSWPLEAAFTGPYKADAVTQRGLGANALTTAYVLNFLSMFKKQKWGD